MKFKVGDIVKYNGRTDLLYKIIKIDNNEYILEFLKEFHQYKIGDIWNCPHKILDVYYELVISNNLTETNNKIINHNCTCGAYKLGYKTQSRMHYGWCSMYKE